MERFFKSFLIGMVKGAAVSLILAVIFGLWWLGHVRFVL